MSNRAKAAIASTITSLFIGMGIVSVLTACSREESETKSNIEPQTYQGGILTKEGWVDSNIQKGKPVTANQENGTFTDNDGHASARTCPDETSVTQSDSGIDGNLETQEDNRQWGWAQDIRGAGYSCIILP